MSEGESKLKNPYLGKDPGRGVTGYGRKSNNLVIGKSTYWWSVGATKKPKGSGGNTTKTIHFETLLFKEKISLRIRYIHEQRVLGKGCRSRNTTSNEKIESYNEHH